METLLPLASGSWEIMGLLPFVVHEGLGCGTRSLRMLMGWEGCFWSFWWADPPAWAAGEGILPLCPVPR